MGNIFEICKECMLFNGSGFYLAYGLLVLWASLTSPQVVRAGEGIDLGRKPPMPGDLGVVSHLSPFASFSSFKASINALLLFAILRLTNFASFREIVQRMLKFIRYVFWMNDKPGFLTSFRRYLTLYAIVIPLPAAFLAPAAHAQRKPDFQLMVAVVLLIIINALGDVISVRITLKNFEKLKFDERHSETRSDQFWQNARNEALYYFSVLKGATYSLLVLVVVLALSSVLYGVQIGEFDFSFSHQFFSGAWDRILRFPELASEPYWFRGEPGPFGGRGIPGLFLYGLITFIPIILLFLLALVWLLLMPLRIAVTLPTNHVQRIVLSEVSVITVCMIMSEVFKMNVLALYSFFTQM